MKKFNPSYFEISAWGKEALYIEKFDTTDFVIANETYKKMKKKYKEYPEIKVSFEIVVYDKINDVPLYFLIKRSK